MAARMSLWAWSALFAGLLTACDDGGTATAPERGTAGVNAEPSSAGSGDLRSSSLSDANTGLGPCVDDDGDGAVVCPGERPRGVVIDCDDRSPDVAPGFQESCDGRDEDCDGHIDEYITNCETADPPGAPPFMDTSGIPPEFDPPPAADTWPDGCVDEDRDRYPVCDATDTTFAQDCDDSQFTDFPGSSWEICDGRDNNCDGRIDEAIYNCETSDDMPDDGWPPEDDAGPTDPDAWRPPPAWGADCVDQDFDGVPFCPTTDYRYEDCDDRDPDQAPGQREICDAVDNDCDGQINEGFPVCDVPTEEWP